MYHLYLTAKCHKVKGHSSKHSQCWSQWDFHDDGQIASEAQNLPHREIRWELPQGIERILRAKNDKKWLQSMNQWIDLQ